MQGILTVCAALGLGAVAFAATQAPSPVELKPGDPAPPFSLPGSDGKVYTLADFKGKKPVVVAWYPKAFTGG
jgi:peroxiredoxin Q/BCP